MSTVIDALAQRLAATGAHNTAAEVAPAVLLWTDGDGRWRDAMPAIRTRLPNLWTLGSYDPAHKQGPAAWVKWHLGQQTEAAARPILYLPGVRRLQFRSLEDFPEELRPIAELQYRGAWWTQSNGKDLTPLAFLTSKNSGLGLDVAEDAHTVSVLEGLVGRILEAPLADLQMPARLEAEHFIALLVDDLEGELLDWLDDAAAMQTGKSPAEWSVFRDFVKQLLGVDLDQDGALVVAERLARREGRWAKVWNRYAMSVPSKYGNVHFHLEKTSPTELMFDKSTLPGHNAEQEQELHAALIGLAGVSENAARVRVRELEGDHGPRRDWVWAKLGKTPLANALAHLMALSDATESPVGGTDREGMADWYSSKGFKADAAALASLAATDHLTSAAIQSAVRALYLPWLQRAAEQLSVVVAASGYPAPAPVVVDAGTCLLFADGLRWDVGVALADGLVGTGYVVEFEGRWAAFPPVTGTSKPDVSPIRDELVGGTGVSDFTPTVRATGKVLNSTSFRKLMAASDVQVLEGNDTGSPSGRGWTEFGDIDKYGHKHGCKTARHVDDQVRELEQRVGELLAAGWKHVRVTTDHGWLLVPGGMPAAKVPAGLAESRWGRCAVLKSTSKIDLPALPWAWDTAQEVTYAPGVCAFYANTEYAHGGLTLQECYTPVLDVVLDRPPVVGSITALRWIRMVCKIQVAATAGGLRLDLRTKVADAATSLVGAAKAVQSDGSCSLRVQNDDHEGAAAVVVLLGPDGSVLDKLSTTIGGEQ